MAGKLQTSYLTYSGQVMHISVNKLTIIGSDNGLSPGQHQAIIWTNAGILSIGPLGANFSEILIEIQTFSLKKIRLKMLSAKWRPFCLCLNVLMASLIHWIIGQSCIHCCIFWYYQFCYNSITLAWGKALITCISTVCSTACFWGLIYENFGVNWPVAAFTHMV